MRKKNHFIKIRVSEDEKKAWTNKAQDAGLPLSELIRQSLDRATIAQKKIKSEPDWQRIRHLARIGNNLNQISRWVNGYKEAADTRRVISVLMEIKRALDAY